MALEFVQRFHGDGQCKPPTCRFEGCWSRAIGTWWDRVTGEAPDLCEKHRAERNAPPMTEGVAYVPSMTLCSGYAMKAGKVVKL